MSHIVITGATGASPRLEISTLIQDAYQFPLYLQALRARRL
jgi:hypothetical protein